MARSPAHAVGGISYDAELSEGHQPNMAMMGREVLLPASLTVQPPEEPCRTQTLFCDRVSSKHAHRAPVRCENSKELFDKHVKGFPFTLNQLVWLYWPRPLLRTRSQKLTRSWTGPWRIVVFKTTIVVVVQNVKTHKKTDGTRGPLGPVP